MNIGYVRVSSEDQNPIRQINQLEEIGIKKIYQEKISGASLDRPELQQMLNNTKEGDVIHVTDLTRISRSTRDLFQLIEEIKAKKAELKSLKDTWLDISDDNPYSHFLLTVIAGVNQLERELIKMRQREGIEIAKKQGKFKGRVKKYTDKHKGLEHAVKLYNSGQYTVKEITEITAVSRSALYRRIKQLQENALIQTSH